VANIKMDDTTLEISPKVKIVFFIGISPQLTGT